MLSEALERPLSPEDRVLASRAIRKAERARQRELIKRGKIIEPEGRMPTLEYMHHHPEAAKQAGRDPQTGAIVYHTVLDPGTQVGKQMAKGVITPRQAIAGAIFLSQYERCHDLWQGSMGFASANMERTSRGAAPDRNVPIDVRKQYHEARTMFFGASCSLLVNVIGSDGMSPSAWALYWNQNRVAGQMPYRDDDAIELLRAVLDDLIDFYDVKERRR